MMKLTVLLPLSLLFLGQDVDGAHGQRVLGECTSHHLSILAAQCDCEYKDAEQGKRWKNEKEYIKCVKSITEANTCTVEDVIVAAGCIRFNPPPPVVEELPEPEQQTTPVDEVPQEITEEEEETSCVGVDYPQLAELAKICDCHYKEPGQVWKNEAEYIKCVDSLAINISCETADIIHASGCLVFAPIVDDEEEEEVVVVPPPQQNETPVDNVDPVIDDLPEVDALTCIETLPQLQELAKDCDCDYKKPGKPWKNEAEYLKCVDNLVADTKCGTGEVVEVSGCLPFQGGSRRLNDPRKQQL